MRSIRASLLVGTVIGMVVVIGVAGVVLHRNVRSTMFEQFDKALEDKVRLLASTVDTKDGEVDLDFEDLDMSEFASADTGGYLQAWLVDGSVLYKSASLGDNNLARLGKDADETIFENVRFDGERRGRAVSLVFYPRADIEEEDEEDADDESDAEMGEDRDDVDVSNDETVELVLARETTEIDTFLAGLGTLLVTIGLLAGLIAAGVLGVVIRRSLNPLDRLAGEISRLGDGDLSSRVAMAPAPLEIAPVVKQLNDLLDRLEAAFERERVFSADIAHELRTPLAGLRSTIEVALSRSRKNEEYKQTLGEALDIVFRTQKIVQKLLYLCRLDAGQLELERKRLDLSELVRTSWLPLTDAATDRGLHIEWNLPPDVIVVTDPMYLEVAIRNVLENAVVHSNKGGEVSVEVNGDARHADLRVVNTGSIVTPDQVPGLTERFTRGDNAREATGSHAGLGLALVRKISSLLGVTVDIQSGSDEFTVTLSIDKPVAASAR